MKVTYEVEYDFSDPKVWKEYIEWLDDYSDTQSERKWFAIDRAIGHEDATSVDPAGTVRVA